MADSLADGTRELAQLIADLPDAIIKTYALESPADRAAQLGTIGALIHIGTANLVSWLERKRSLDTARNEYARIDALMSEANACAQQPIPPEYVGGKLPTKPHGQHPSPGAVRIAVLLVTCMATGVHLSHWADDIAEAEQTKGVRRSKKAKRGRPVNEQITRRNKRIVEAWGTGHYRTYEDCAKAFESVSAETVRKLVTAAAKSKRTSR